MKKFLVILVGIYLGNIVYISATWHLYTPDFYSYTDILLVSFGISIIFSLIARYSLRIFSIGDINLLYLGITFFIAQILISMISIILPDYGPYTVISFMLICYVGAAFCLGLLKKRRQ